MAELKPALFADKEYLHVNVSVGVLNFKTKIRMQCSTLMVARLPGATKNFNRAGKFSTVVAQSGNNKLHRLLHLNLLPTLVVNMFKIKKYHNMYNIGKDTLAKLEICSFVDHKLAVFTYLKCNFSLCTSQRCDQQKLSNLACSVKLKDWTRKWDQAV